MMNTKTDAENNGGEFVSVMWGNSFFRDSRSSSYESKHPFAELEPDEDDIIDMEREYRLENMESTLESQYALIEELQSELEFYRKENRALRATLNELKAIINRV